MPNRYARTTYGLNRGSCAWLTCLLLIAMPSVVSADPANARAVQNDAAPSGELPYHPSRLLVRYKARVATSTRQATLRAAAATRVLARYRLVDGLELVEVSADRLDASLAAFRADPNVRYAEPDYRIETAAIPNDALFDLQWGLHNTGQTINGVAGTPGADIRASEAWDLFTGNPNFRIALIDTGVDYNHPDLAANIWTNSAEANGITGVDDDGNGYVDDIHGYDTGDDDGDPMDSIGHGTHLAGIIGALGNNTLGVAGVNWRCKLVPLKFFDSQGLGFTSDAVEALQYAVDNGIRLSNNSWGVDREFSQTLYDAIEASQSIGHLFVAAAGNLLGRNIDLVPFYPASFDLPNIIAVAATENDDLLSIVSNIGPDSVDLAAPGFDIYSTARGGGYEFQTGTSMSCAYVTGVAGLMIGRRPSLTWDDIKFRILATVRPLPTLADRTVTGGIVNAVAAVGDCNGNGTIDETDIITGASEDCNGNGLPDECEPDCNGNTIPDDCDLALGTAFDCNGNGVPDACDLSSGTGRDCNGNRVPDECDIASGTSLDVNTTGVPDECEQCGAAIDCDDGNQCTAESCDAGLCFWTALTGPCDDGDPCTADDSCVDGLCTGTQLPALECAPILSMRAIAINETPIPDGPVGAITVARGDRIEIEMYAERWAPDTVQLYNLLIDVGSYLSGSTGRLVPLRDPTPAAGAFIDESRPDYIFFGTTVFAGVVNFDPSFYLYGGVLLFLSDCAVDDGTPAYLGTLILDVSDTAAGTFAVCLEESLREGSFLNRCPDPFVIVPMNFECLTVNVPLSEADCARTPDCNGNGRWDICDIHEGTSLDCNRNDVPDACDLSSGASPDCNGNTIPDECDLATETSADCNINSVPDECDIASLASPDCNDNAMPDECEPGSDQDCNNNQNPDLCDIHAGIETDCNMNVIPDACDLRDGPSLDCNANGIPDECDITAQSSTDCDGDGILDECEPDCNENGIPDDCDIAAETSVSCADNGIPDECLGLFSGGLLATYFTNLGLTGESLTRVDPRVSFYWEMGGPDPLVGDDTFSVRWEGWLQPPLSETYTFYLTADDGSRLWIDDEFLIDQWEIQDLTEWTATVPLTGGTLHRIRVESFEWYYEKTVLLAWSSPSTPREIIPSDRLFFHVADCNENLVPDTCDRLEGLSGDCNATGQLDICDITQGLSADCNLNELPDECEWAAPQDLCADAESICPGITYTGSTVDRAADGDASCANSADSPDVYYRYVPATDGEATMSLCNGTDYDAALSVHFGCPAAEANEVACNDDACNAAGPAEIVLEVEAGVEYLIRVTGWYKRSGNFVLNIDGPDCLTGDGDCNNNAVLDTCDIDDGFSEDCNFNETPDECEPNEDCNSNTRPDICDLADGTSLDCNSNDAPDECDIADGTALDCNANAVPDACESDSDSDGIIDDCDGCPQDPANDADGDGVCAPEDGCPQDPLKSDPRQCGCGVADDDFDADGAADCIDNCVSLANPSQLDSDLDGAGDACDVCPFDPDDDGDGDGVCRPDDRCPDHPAKQDPGQCGCAVPDIDSDGDTVADCIDACDGLDDTIDTNLDGVPDCAESIPTLSHWGLMILALFLLVLAKISFKYTGRTSPR